MNAPERFSELWTDYLEGDLDESGYNELRELLAGNENLLKLAADLYQTHRLLGLIVEEVPERQEEFIRSTLSKLPVEPSDFISEVMAGVEQVASDEKAIRSRYENHSNNLSGKSRYKKFIVFRGILASVVLAIFAVSFYSFWPAEESPHIAKDDVNPTTETELNSNVRFANLAHAKFFGELLPPINSIVAPKRDYVLMSGLVEVRFPAGASAILEGPAVFRVLSDESLALDVGHCSVYAPDGAEGFRVETPVTRVVDRGTRFSVSVDETSETEVQVIEGTADVYQKPESFRRQTTQGNPMFEVRLKGEQSQTFSHVGKFSAKATPFNSNVYHLGLPDRVVSYTATVDASGRAENLTSVSVQRGGRLIDIPVSELIPIEVTSFIGPSEHAHIASNGILPQRRSLTSSDQSLVTGVINPGGSREPLASDPVIVQPDDLGRTPTPGMAVRFKSPVFNGPGADVVFFDLQTFGNPPDGDAFHVSPLQFKEGLKSHTIRLYDLTMESPAALDLAGFRIHMFEEPVKSLAMLESADCASRFAGMKFRGLVVGIDLSDLGYKDGESVEGLFFQDALDDKHNVDPVFIAGLPSVDAQDTQE